MAYYDPYADQGYGQQDYGYGYDEYGYGYGYEEPPQEERPLPPPDKNWMDPVKVNREYMNKIQKDCIQKEFQGLREEGFYLLEVLIEAVHLKKEDTEEGSKQKIEDEPKLTVEEPFETNVKFLHFKFMEVNGPEIAEKAQRTERVPSYTDLFQTVFTVAGRHKSLGSEEKTVSVKDVGDAETQESREENKEENVERKIDVKEDDKTAKDFNTVQLMKGKAALISTTGLEMIQNLQRYPVRVRLDRGDLTLGTTSVTLPQRFQNVVLNASTSDVVLPYLTVCSGQHTFDQDTGKVSLTIVLTCYGQAIVNGISEVPDTNNFKFNNTTLWNRFKFTGTSSTSEPTPIVHPKVALDVLKMGIPCDTRTSSEILQKYCASNLIHSESPPKINKCDWFGMARESLPQRISTGNYDQELMEKEREEEVAALWRKHRQICRELKNQETQDRQKSLYERLEEVRMPAEDIPEENIADEYVLIDTNNPFEEEAQKTIADIGALSVEAPEDAPRKSSLKSPKK